MNYSEIEENEGLLVEMKKDVEGWDMQECVKKLKKDDPERWERSRQFVANMKHFENLLRLKIKDKESKNVLDIEFIICIYNLFLSISN